jgi:hypothetical protein
MFGLKGDAKGLFLQLAEKAGKNPEDFIKQARKDGWSGTLKTGSGSAGGGFNIGGSFNTAGKFKKGGKIGKPRGCGIAKRGYGKAMKGSR